MVRQCFLLTLVLFFSKTTFSQYTLSGRIIDSLRRKPVEFAVVSVQGSGLQTSADEKGYFSLKRIPAGKTTISVSYLGYKRKLQEVNVSSDIKDLTILLREDNLKLNEVHITAEKNPGPATSYEMDRQALDHMQVISVADATSLLPGGKTNTRFHLAGSERREILVNGRASEEGNTEFGVAVEVDGVRLSNNALPYIGGNDTRNIASSNIESVEIVTGVPSAEYGDLTNGMVRITTRKGKSPFILDLITQPNTKQIALGKGFSLGARSGVLNLSIEHTRSISDLASPYTSYDRNALSLNYSNTFNRNGNAPLDFNFSIAGNTGGFDTKPDPDLFINTYRKINDGAVRGNISANWRLNKPWITSLEISGSVNYNDSREEISSNKSSPSSVAAIHVTEEGYHVGELYAENPDAGIILIPLGSWYELKFNDSKTLNYSAKLKGNWSHRQGRVNNNLVAGGTYDASGNHGKGIYYQDVRFAPTWRGFRYDKLPYVHNFSLFAEDKASIAFGKSSLQLTAGVRSDITAIKGSLYGTVGNLSPRFNAKYIFPQRHDRLISNFSIKAAWGKTVKLPSMTVLNPQPSYVDILAFSPGTTAGGETFYAYYTMPGTMLYNENLKWQRNIQQEIGVNMTVSGTNIDLVLSRDQTYDPYDSQGIYAPFTYKFTDESNLDGSLIPIENRIYSIDQTTGIVTVKDRTGVRPTETLLYKERATFKSNTLPINGSSVERTSLRWIVSFKQIRPLRTSVRIDGNYYRYRAVDKILKSGTPSSSAMADGNPYKYIGFYEGGRTWSNGSLTKNLDMNLTLTTHIPAVRMVFSARLEASLYDFSQNLSESGNGARGFVIDSKNDYFPSKTQTDIYGGDRFVGVYPDYYVSLDDMNTRIPFAEKFAWAKDNDPALFNELAKMVVKTNYIYSFNKSGFSPYYMVRFGVTKEIGRVASISFNATNFLNSTDLVRKRETGSESSLFNSSTIPNFYYGLSLRLKW